MTASAPASKNLIYIFNDIILITIWKQNVRLPMKRIVPRVFAHLLTWKGRCFPLNSSFFLHPSLCRPAPYQSSFQCPSMSFSYFCTPYVAPEGGERTCLVARPRSEAQDRPSPVRDRPAGRPPPLTRPPLTRPQLYQRDTRYPYTIYLGPSQEDTRAIVLDLCLLPFFLNRGWA